MSALPQDVLHRVTSCPICNGRGWHSRNYGAILAIRTGPADFSQKLVTAMKQGGRYRQQEGYVRYVNSGDVRSCPTEEEFFRLCAVPFVEPSRRPG